MIVAGNFNDTLALPFTLTAVLVLVPSVILMFLAVPQFAVVMLAVPLNDVPLMVRAVCNLVAVAALPVQALAVAAVVAVAAFPEMLLSVNANVFHAPHVPLLPLR